MLMGTLLPAPIIGYGQSSLVRSLVASGHEVGLHAWDHVAWHDRLWKMKPERIEAEIRKGMAAFSSLTGIFPVSFAAPAWRINAAAARMLKQAGMSYMSATRGVDPYFPVFSGQKIDLLEIPTTLPTADEILGRDGIDIDLLSDYLLGRILEPGLHVLTVHAEMEGRGLAKSFARTLDVCLARRVNFVRLMDIAWECLSNPQRVPADEVIRSDLPGRPGKVSCQSR
jgi:peptidoglycan/xylan/chitin deacetylase (PgdA/CDA1 family)